MGKTIITCAITGGIHTPLMSDTGVSLERQGNALATTYEARALLGLKGADQTCV